MCAFVAVFVSHCYSLPSSSSFHLIICLIPVLHLVTFWLPQYPSLLLQFAETSHQLDHSYPSGRQVDGLTEGGRAMGSRSLMVSQHSQKKSKHLLAGWQLSWYLIAVLERSQKLGWRYFAVLLCCLEIYATISCLASMLSSTNINVDKQPLIPLKLYDTIKRVLFWFSDFIVLNTGLIL